ncbi:MAG: TerD family protein [Cytophagaceae bacterium]|nr:TerD family protein [Cytophagaceae bacterium]MDW8457285.1 TerD family protein [Cytophagaceae bacterium]
MTIKLNKGESFNISKEVPGLKKLMIGLGWDFTTDELDLDASVFMLGPNGKLINNDYFVYFNNLKSPDGAVHHTGDNKSGVGTDDDEAILINLDAVNHDVTDIVVVVSINDADVNGHKFGMLKDAYIRLYDEKTKKEIVKYDLDAENASNTEVEFAKIHRIGNEWTFTAIGKGTNSGLQSYLEKYS